MVYETSAENSPMMPRLNFNALASNIAEHFQNALPAKLNGLPPIKNPMPLQTEQDMSSSPSELYHDQVNGGEAVTTDVSIEKTFLHMQIRKVQRRYGGKVKETSAARSIWFLAFLSIFTGCGILSYSNSGDSIYNLQLIFISPTAVQESWSVILFIVVTMLTLYVGTYSALVVRIVILWGALAVTVMVLILRKPLTSIALVGNSCPSEAYIGTEACPTRALPCEIRLNGTSTCVATETTQVQQIILFVLLSFEAFTLVLWFYSHHLYTYLVKTNHLTAKGWWKLRAYPNYPNTYTFWTFSEFPYLCRTKHTCQYRGDLNNGGRPHGWGQWIDDSRNGERLNGWWDDGIPLGPFVSREFRSGYGFTCVRVGFALCRLDEWHRSSFIPRCGALRVGIAAVECSTSGRFFRYFPSSRIVFPEVPVEPSTIPVPEGSGTWVNALLQHMNHYKDRDTVDSVVVRAEDRRTLFISGHYPASPDAERHTTISVVPTGRVGASDPETPQGPQEGTLRINGWLPLHLRAEFAVLLYFPGYNNSCQDSCESFAQLLTLGDFPAHLTPWVFSYPAGQILSYFKAKAQAEDPRTTDYIRQLLLAFREAGCRQIHVMSHSMGATAWLASVPRVVDVFSPTGMQLATCTLLNPDFPRDRFRTECFAALRTACSCITMYADARDGALRWSERLNRHGRCLMRPEPSGPGRLHAL